MDNTFDKKKIRTIIAVVVLGVVIIVAIALINIIPKIGKIKVHVAYAPFIAEVKLNDNEINNNSDVYLEPGEYMVHVSLEGFEPLEQTVVIDEENDIIYGNITAQTEEANKIANEHINDYYAVEAYASQIISKEGEKARKEWPIITVLPITNSLYKIGYITNDDNELVVTVDTVSAYMDTAVQKLKDAANGVDDLAKYRVEVSGYYDSLAGNFVENDASSPDEYIKSGFGGVLGFEFVSGLESEDYYIAKVKAGTEETYSVVTYIMIIRKEDGKWKFVSKPGQIMTLYNTIDVPIEVLDAANNM